jgi:hypothetical protein
MRMDDFEGLIGPRLAKRLRSYRGLLDGLNKSRGHFEVAFDCFDLFAALYFEAYSITAEYRLPVNYSVYGETRCVSSSAENFRAKFR